MRNMLKAFRPASFRGVSFSVITEDMGGGRRLSIHPIAYGETPVIEDMGKAEHRFPITAYVAGDDFDGRAAALAAALAAKGPATLVLPMHGIVLARVEAWSRSRAKDAAGYIAFDVAFIEAGTGSAPFSAIAGAGAIGAALSAGASLLAAALSRAYAGRMDARASTDTADARAAAAGARSLASLTSPATSLPADAESALAALSVAGTAAVADPAGFAGALVEAWRQVAIAADPEALRAEIAMAIAPATSATGAAINAAMLGAYAMATVSADYRAQADAAAARAALAALASAAIEDAAAFLGDDATAWVAQMTGEAALSISAGAANRAPLVLVETGLSVSAIVAAYALYGDANRDAEIVDRNPAGNAVFLPLRFEALAPDA